MNDSRRFRMSTSFYMPVGDFDSKISTMREYLQKPDSGVRYPVLSADAKTKRVSLDLIVDAGTWKSAEDKADSALMGALDAAQVDLIMPDTDKSMLDNRVTELALV
ncbi:hypothetical protein KSX19_10895 [Bifidobacterium longum]|uniref:Uncharacterized protein n=2 Tax=Bifidobacterium longum TaxID=216816 RepID=A0AAW4NNE2_BIFLN|nr:hypothetical protein [Bifidobacterium longum]MBU9885908.1 hypothetical protein [Bifidobacterium longum]MBV3439459.1 hypothetical protein [Bifidobacterium longum]MBV3496237.1 hypothetical protein [Bifidobacterium longum]MBV3533640.1 hypothetical protein [Bifidobacterium longum]MBV3535669.1 hypothetical protein [Bifidobacterium longum]